MTTDDTQHTTSTDSAERPLLDQRVTRRSVLASLGAGALATAAHRLPFNDGHRSASSTSDRARDSSNRD